MKKPEKMIIYNIFPLLAGKFSEWRKHLERASKMGFNWVFLNPISLPGFSGSLYSVKDYFRVHSLLIDNKSKKSQEKQLKEMINTAEKNGLKLMVDLVINHCAIDSDLIKEHPEWFVWENGQVAHPFCMEGDHKLVWGDLAKFDHRHTSDPEGLYQFFVKIVHHFIELGFRGFRCDAAYQLPGRLWKRLIRETKSRFPNTLFFAETLGCTAEQTRKTAKAGFNYIFNSSKWWDFYSPWLLENYNLTREISPSVSFPESHDTKRLCNELNGNINGLKQRYLFSALFSAGVMMPMGFEFGFRVKPDVVKTRPEYWEETDIDLTHFVEKVNRIKEKYAVFQEESPTNILNYDNPNLLLIWKASTTTKDEALIVINKDIQNRHTFYAEDLKYYVQAGAPLHDVSPEYPVEYISSPFSYDLNPGQGLVFVTKRDIDMED